MNVERVREYDMIKSVETTTYHYQFQCWNCLKHHEGMVESDTEKLQIECKEYVTNLFLDPLFVTIGKPRYCGVWNSCVGRRIKSKNKKNNKK